MRNIQGGASLKRVMSLSFDGALKSVTGSASCKVRARSHAPWPCREAEVIEAKQLVVPYACRGGDIVKRRRAMQARL